MKFILAFCLFLNLNANAQLKYFLEYNISAKNKFIDLNNPSHFIVSNNISIGTIKNKMLYSLGLGREDWFLNFFYNGNVDDPSTFTYYCHTYKLTPMIERELKIPKSSFSFRIGVGGKFFFLNQMKDSLSHSEDDNFFSVLKPSVISKFNPVFFNNIVNGYDFGSLNEYYYITSVPYAFTVNLAIQYSFKNWAIKLQYDPTWIKVKTRNAGNVNDKSSAVFFYNNLGLGINYPLNFKKKEINTDEPE